MKVIVGIAEVVDLLMRLRVEGEKNPHVEIRYDDLRVRWSDFGECTNAGLPALGAGSQSDCRWPIADSKAGLHGIWKRHTLQLHIDAHDPTRFPVMHILKDTRIIHGVGLGGATGAIGAGLVESDGARLLGGLLGAIVGGFAGAWAQPDPSSVWRLNAAGLWESDQELQHVEWALLS